MAARFLAPSGERVQASLGVGSPDLHREQNGLDAAARIRYTNHSGERAPGRSHEAG